MMFSVKKGIELSDTASSFNQCSTDKENTNDHNTEILKLQVKLIEKKNKLKELKIQNEQLKAKQDQQQVTIAQIMITFDYQLQSQQEINRSNQKHLESQQILLQEIKSLKYKIEQLKDQTIINYQQAIQHKNNKQILNEFKHQKQCKLKEIKDKNEQVEEQLLQLDKIIELNQSQVRTLQKQHTNQLIQNVDFENQINSLQAKIRKIVKETNSLNFHGRQLMEQSKSIQSKTALIKQKNNQVQFQCQKFNQRNQETENINNQIRDDLEGVTNHLNNIKAVNQLILQNLAKYSITSRKVEQLIKAQSMI